MEWIRENKEIWTPIGLIVAVLIFAGVGLWLSVQHTKPSFDKCESIGGGIHKVDYVFKCIKDGSMVEL